MPRTTLPDSALFMPDAQGKWSCICTNCDYVHIGELLCHVCERYEIDCYNYLQFARWIFPNLTITLRAYDALRVQLTFYKPSFNTTNLHV